MDILYHLVHTLCLCPKTDETKWRAFVATELVCFCLLEEKYINSISWKIKEYQNQMNHCNKKNSYHNQLIMKEILHTSLSVKYLPLDFIQGYHVS